MTRMAEQHKDDNDYDNVDFNNMQKAAHKNNSMANSTTMTIMPARPEQHNDDNNDNNGRTARRQRLQQ